MKIRPVDNFEDVLPVLHISDMKEKVDAVAILVKDRLSVFYGEWWENSNYGFPVLRQMKESWLSEVDAKSFSSMITEYIRQTDGVNEVINVVYQVIARQFVYSCVIITEYGDANIDYQVNV